MQTPAYNNSPTMYSLIELQIILHRQNLPSFGSASYSVLKRLHQQFRKYWIWGGGGDPHKFYLRGREGNEDSLATIFFLPTCHFVYMFGKNIQFIIGLLKLGYEQITFWVFGSRKPGMYRIDITLTVHLLRLRILCRL